MSSLLRIRVTLFLRVVIFNVMTYPIQFGLSNHCLFNADFAASGLGLIL